QLRARTLASDGAPATRAPRGHPAFRRPARGGEHSGTLGIPRRRRDDALVEPAIGPERAGRLYPLGGLQRAGATLVGGSDWSVMSMDPLPAIEVAVTRRAPRAPAGPPWLPEEVISLDAMLMAYTINGARLQLQEDETGSITVSKAADLVVLDRDLR